MDRKKEIGRIPSVARAAVRAIARVGQLLPLTARGVVVVVLSALALWPFGFGNLDLVLFIIGLLGLLLTALAVVLTVLQAVLYRRRPKPASTPALRLESGSLQSTGFSLPRLRRIPLVELTWYWRLPNGVLVRPRPRGSQLIEEIVAERRCLADGIERRFEVYDVFGLARSGWSRRESAPVLALPALGRLRAAPLVRALAAADGVAHPSGNPDGDRMEIRRYAPGDSIRHIMWKTFARTRELNVRLPERSVERARKTVAYLVSGAGDEPAAAAARAALESGSLGEDWLFGADGTDEPTADLERARLAIARSADAAEAVGAQSGLADFLERVSPTGAAHCVVFAPALHGPWCEAAITMAQRRRSALSFVLATDGVTRPQPRLWWQRLLLRPPESVGTPVAALGELVRALARTGAEVQVVDRPTGRHFGAAHTARLPQGMAA